MNLTKKLIDIAMWLLADEVSVDQIELVVREQGDKVAEEMTALLRGRIKARSALSLRQSNMLALRQYRGKPKSVVTLGSMVLGRPMFDKEIELGLPDDHLFERSTLNRIIRELLSGQPRGKEGVLTTKGNNMFYTRSGVVSVWWYERHEECLFEPDIRYAEWRTYTTKGRDKWNEHSSGSRVFFPSQPEECLG